MFNTLWNSIPRNGLVWEWLLDGNAFDTAGTNNGTATNVIYVKTSKGYQSQAGSFKTNTSQIEVNHIAWYELQTFSWNLNIRLEWTTSCHCVYKQRWSVNYDIAYSCVFRTTWFSFAQQNGSNYTLNTSIPWTFIQNKTYNVTVIKEPNLWTAYVDWILLWTLSAPAISYSTWNKNTFHWKNPVTTAETLNWQIQSLRHYNRKLSQDEIQTLYLESLRKLWPSNIANYPSLLSELVGYFRAENIWWNALYNLVNWIVVTRVWWTNTTDNLWIKKAISNPNYTWASLTYTTWYTFENSWSGWSLVTTPAWLSATWINRTTKLRDIFLFSRTLSIDERNLLENLCNSEYPYPTPSYDLPNLRDWLVLDLNEWWQDLSRNGNNGFLVNLAPAKWLKQLRAKGLSYNGNDAYIDNIWMNNITLWNSDKTIALWIKPWYTADRVIYNLWNTWTNTQLWLSLHTTNEIKAYISGWPNILSWIIATKIHHIVLSKNWNEYKLYIDWILRNTTTYANLNITWTQHQVWALWKTNYWSWWIFNPRVRNKALSGNEIQALYYSQKWNFIY